MATREEIRMEDLRRQREEQKRLQESIKEQQLMSQIQSIIKQLIKEEYKRIQTLENAKQQQTNNEIKTKLLEIQRARVAKGGRRKKDQ